jgi:enoyl-CoA hydratase
MSALLPGGRVDETIEPKSADIRYGTDEPVRYEADGPIAWITMNRPGCGNAQNSQMTYALDAALRRAVDDDAIKVIIGGAGRNFSGGHDIGTPGRDVHKSCPPP